jgi:hypothetical protein
MSFVWQTRCLQKNRMSDMRYFILIIFAGFMSAFAQEKPAKISIYSTPNHIEVRLDSLIIGSTPITNFEVRPGEHHLEGLTPLEGLWNLNNIGEDFSIKSGQDTVFHIKFLESVKINSVPYHAELIRDNRVLGLTPLYIPFDKNKGKELLLEKKGYRSFRFVLEKKKSQLYELEKIGNNELTEVERRSFTHALFHTRLKSKFLFLTGTVLTHWLAFYFKNLADDNFEKYESTANQQQMNKYWDNTQKFDRYSDISLGVSYALLTGLIYTVVRR